jgi:hypothetical protein
MADTVGVVQVILSGKDESLASAMKKAENDVTAWKKRASESVYGWSKDVKKSVDQANNSFKDNASTLATVAKGFVAVQVATKAFRLAQKEITEIIGGMRDAAGANSKVSQEMRGQAIIAEESMKKATDAYDKMNQVLGSQLAPVIGFIAEDIGKMFTSFSDGLNLNQEDLEWFAGVWGTVKTEVVLIKSVFSVVFNSVKLAIAGVVEVVGLLVKGLGYLTFSDTLKDFGNNLTNVAGVLMDQVVPAMEKAGVEFRQAVNGEIYDQTQKDFQKYSQNMVANAKKVGEQSGKEQARAFAKSYEDILVGTDIGKNILAKQAEESAKTAESLNASLMPLLIELDALRVARGEIAANESVFSNQEADDQRRANEQNREAVRSIQEQIEKVKALIDEKKFLLQAEKELANWPTRTVGPDGVVSIRGDQRKYIPPPSRGSVIRMQDSMRPDLGDFSDPIDLSPMVDRQKIIDEAMNDETLKGARKRYKLLEQEASNHYSEINALRIKEAEAMEARAGDIATDPEVTRQLAINALKIRYQVEHNEAMAKIDQQNRIAMMQAGADFFGNMATLTEDAAQKNKAFFYANKAFAMAQAEINALMAFSNILGNAQMNALFGPAVTMAMAGTALAAGQVAVGRIAAQEMAGGRAAGGAVLSGGLYEVNERGPEMLSVGDKSYLMMGNKSGMVTPNAGRSPAPTVIVNVHTQPGTTARTEQGGTSDAPTLEVFIEKIDQATAAGIRSGTSATSRALQSTYGVNRSRGGY